MPLERLMLGGTYLCMPIYQQKIKNYPGSPKSKKTNLNGYIAALPTTPFHLSLTNLRTTTTGLHRYANQYHQAHHALTVLDYRTRPPTPSIAFLCLPSQLFGASALRCKVTLFICIRLARSCHADAMSLFSRSRFCIYECSAGVRTF